MSIITTPFAYFDCLNNSYVCEDCITYSTHEFIACQGDIWQLEDNAEFPLYGRHLCRDGNIVIPNFVKKGDVSLSQMQITISGIASDSKFRIINVCNGNVRCSFAFNCIYDHLKRSDFATDDDYAEAIFIYMKCIYHTDDGNYVDNGDGSFTITIQWYGDSLDNYCRCNSTFTWLDLPVTAFDTTDCALPIVKKSYKVNCIAADEYVNIYQVHTFNMCVSIVQNPTCIKKENLVKLDFSDLPTGCYNLCNNENCTSKIRVVFGQPTANNTFYHCNTVWLEARNSNESWIKCRLSFMNSNPLIKKNQEISRSSKGIIRKLYTTMERDWLIESDYYPSNTHAFIAQLIEKDYFYMESIFDNDTQTQKKRFNAEDTWNVKWETNLPRIKVAKGECNLTEYEYNYVNEFC